MKSGILLHLLGNALVALYGSNQISTISRGQRQVMKTWWWWGESRVHEATGNVVCCNIHNFVKHPSVEWNCRSWGTWNVWTPIIFFYFYKGIDVKENIPHFLPNQPTLILLDLCGLVWLENLPYQVTRDIYSRKNSIKNHHRQIKNIFTIKIFHSLKKVE